MHWGIRRYQNPDGSLTEAGKKRYYSIDDSGEQVFRLSDTGARDFINQDGSLTDFGKQVLDSMFEKNLDAGIKEITESRSKRLQEYINAGLKEVGDEVIISKSTNLGRVAGKNDVVDEKRKYLFVRGNETKTEDERMYEDAGTDGELWIDPDDDVYGFTYKTNKDLKIAGRQQVLDYYLDKYGDRTLDNGTNAAKTYEAFEYLSEKHIKPDKTNDELGNLLLLKLQDNKYSTFGAYEKAGGVEETLKYFKEKGYDGIVDPTDTLMNYADYAIILDTPIDKIKQTSKKKLK